MQSKGAGAQKQPINSSRGTPHLARIKHQHAISVHNSVQAVRYHDDGAIRKAVADSSLDSCIRHSINVCRRLKGDSEKEEGCIVMVVEHTLSR